MRFAYRTPAWDNPYRMHPLTLRFPAETEQAFQDDFEGKSLPYVRAALAIVALNEALALTVFASSGRLNPVLALATVATLAGLGLSFISSCRGLMRPYVAATLALAALVVVYRMGAERALPELPALVVGVPIIIMIVAFNARLGVPLATAASAAAVGVVYAGAAILGVALSPLTTTFVVMAFLISVVTGYTAERLVRREYTAQRLLAAERLRSERLLLNILPAPIAQRLMMHGGTIADSHPDVTVLFADVVDFTRLSASLSPERLVERLDRIFSAYDALTAASGLEKIKTTGDAYMVVGGLPMPQSNHVEAVAEVALAMLRATAATGDGLQVRIGIHTGPVVAGVIGSTKFTYDLWGDTVNIASRMESHGLPGCIQVSEAVFERLRQRYELAPRGVIEVKGKGMMQTYLLTGPAQAAGEPGAGQSMPARSAVRNPAA
jgi:class 3 adenylate cyclase